MFIKKDKKSLFSISIFNSFFKKSYFSFILKFFGIVQIIVLIFLVYVAVTLEKKEIKVLIHSVAQQTYWFGKMLTNLPAKWSNNISSKHPILNIEISQKNYQLLMKIRDDEKKNKFNYKTNEVRVPGVMNYKDDKYDIRVRLKGDDIVHLRDSKWSMRIALNNDRFMDMKRFSLHDPKRRSYMASFMLHEFTKNENLTTAKFNLIPVSINGKYMGVYNYEEVPDHNMNELLTGINNIVVRFDDDEMWNDIKKAIQSGDSGIMKNELHVKKILDLYLIVKAHSFNEVLNDEILKKDFERASKLLHGFRDKSFTASEVFDFDKLSVYLAMTDLFGAYHGTCGGNIRLVYDRDLDRLYPIVWDAYSENSYSSVDTMANEMFKLESILAASNFDPSAECSGPSQMLLDQDLIAKYLEKLDEITSPEYIDDVMKVIKPQVDNYMSILNLDYPQFKIEDEIKRLKENAEYLRSVYLYPEIPFYAYLSDDNKLNSLILVNRKPVPIKIISLIDVSTDQQFRVKSQDSNFLLKNYIRGTSVTPTKVFFECPMNNCFAKKNIKDLRVVAKIVGTDKNISVQVNNWTAYEIN